LRKVDTFSNPGNTERFRVFYEILPPISGSFASLRTSPLFVNRRRLAGICLFI
jgi:hypothetical protein